MTVRQIRKAFLWVAQAGFLTVWMVATLFVPVRVAQAQGGAVLSVLPSSGSLGLGSEVQLTLWVTGGVNVNAFDVTVTYDPAVLSLSKWEKGAYLSSLAVVSQVNQPGLLQVAATQLAQPAVSGDGALLTMTFMGISEGSSDIVIAEAIFADSMGHKTYPATENGSLTVVLEQSPSSTPISTATPTVTRTATLTATPTRTPTPTVTSTSAPSATLTSTATPTRTATRASNGSPTRTVTTTTIAPGSNGPPPTDTQTGQPPEPTPTEAQVIAGEETDDQDEPTPEADGNNFVIENIKKITQNAKTREERLNRLVWAFLIGALLLEGILFLALLRRNKKRKDDDYLL